jgi:hypothetical protein
MTVRASEPLTGGKALSSRDCIKDEHYTERRPQRTGGSLLGKPSDISGVTILYELVASGVSARSDQSLSGSLSILSDQCL